MRLRFPLRQDERVLFGFAEACSPFEKAVFFFRSRLTLPGRVKAEPQIETWQRRSAAAFTPAVILFIALPESKDNIDPG